MCTPPTNSKTNFWIFMNSKYKHSVNTWFYTTLTLLKPLDDRFWSMSFQVVLIHFLHSASDSLKINAGISVWSKEAD